MATIDRQPTSTSGPQPAWDVALLFPNQGDWGESDYLALETNQLVELVNGNLEVLPMPTLLHQGILRFLHKILDRFVENENRGTVYFAPLRVRIRDKTFREPDIVYVASEHFALLGEKYLRGADLVMEIVSPDDKSQARDYQEKRIDYAALGITEYWIVDPKVQRITVLVLEEKQYRTHGEFSLGEEATSVLLDGFKVDVASVIAAGQIPA